MTIVSKAAKVNGVTLPADFTLEPEITPPTAGLSQLCSSKALIRTTLILCFNW